METNTAIVDLQQFVPEEIFTEPFPGGLGGQPAVQVTFAYGRSAPGRFIFGARALVPVDVMDQLADQFRDEARKARQQAAGLVVADEMPPGLPRHPV